MMMYICVYMCNDDLYVCMNICLLTCSIYVSICSFFRKFQ